MSQDLDKSPAVPFDLIYEGPTVGWTKVYGGGSGGGSGDWWVDARDFGVLGNGFTDDTDGLQAAVDWGFANGKRAVRMPMGFYCIVRKSIWLAPPGSYDNVDPLTGGAFDAFQFSMALIGHETDGDSLYNGVTIEAWGETDGAVDFNKPWPEYPVIIVGPGQGMRVVGINVRAGAGSLWPTSFYQTSIGIAISGGPGGASRTVIERCWIQNLYTGIRTGWNEDSLADSNTFIKCVTNTCYYGLDIFRTQNYINNVFDCNFEGVISIRSTVGKAVNVWGGNYSHAGNVDQDFNISGTTALTPGPVAAMQAFDTTLSFPGIGLGGLDQFSKNALTDGGQILYTVAAIETAHFGVIPLQPLAFNATTDVMSLLIDSNWILANFGVSFDFSTTDLEAEIQAATLLMMAVRRTSFQGSGIHARGVHIECPGAVHTLVDQISGFQGDRGCIMEDVYLNWDPTLDVNSSQRKIMSCWPWIDLNQANFCTVRGGQFSSSEQLPFLFGTNGSVQLIFDNLPVRKFNMRTAGNFFGNINAGGGDAIISPIRGFGIYKERTPFLPRNDGGHGILFVKNGLGIQPHKGVVPDPMPLLTQAYVDTLLSGTLPAKGEYPPLFGNVPYGVIRIETTAKPYELFLVSNHDFYSYGQDFSVNWSYKGQSHHLYVDNLDWFFSGLKFGIDNGSGVKWYVVVGIYPNVALNNTGYLIVHAYDNGFAPVPLFGNKTTVFTGGTIFQEPYVITLGDRSKPLVTSQFDKTSDTTLAAITGLTVNVLAGKKYTGHVVLYTTSGAAGGVKVGTGGTATATGFHAAMSTYTTSAAGAAAQTTTFNASIGGATAAITAVVVDFSINVNAAGTLTITFAQNASDGTTSSVLVGSYMLLDYVT